MCWEGPSDPAQFRCYDNILLLREMISDKK